MSARSQARASCDSTGHRHTGVLVVIGDLVEDVVVWLHGAVEHATDNPAVIHRARGGSAANLAAAAAPHVPTRFIGRVGRDHLGDHLARQMRACGADARLQREGRTGSVVILVHPGGERTMLPDRAAAAELSRVRRPASGVPRPASRVPGSPAHACCTSPPKPAAARPPPGVVAHLRSAGPVDAVRSGHRFARAVLSSPGAGGPGRPSPAPGRLPAGRRRRTRRQPTMSPSSLLAVSAPVTEALAERRPVVAMESTIFSALGLPAPAGEEALARCTRAVEAHGAVPAVTAVLDGVWRVGLNGAEEERVLRGERKVAERDLAVAAAQHWEVGVTTVSASLALAELAGIAVFATGGIGGVHRGAELTGDISADLDALAHHRVIAVCAGAKAFLDLPRTLEYLETAGVAVLGWHHDWFPAFYLRSSGLRVPHRASSPEEVARTLLSGARQATGVLLTVPIPQAAELSEQQVRASVATALEACQREGIAGPAVTPFVLAGIERETLGHSVEANLALAENNADVAAQVAVACASLAGHG